MSLSDQLSAVIARFQENVPEADRKIIVDAKDQFIKTFDPSTTIKVTDTLPQFRLPNAAGEEVSSANLLSQGPLLITFYRGSWCPFCDLAVASLQRHLDTFRAKGVTLVAITPELPDHTLSTTEKHSLQFPVLTDRGNKYAEQLGLLFQMPAAMGPVLAKAGKGLVEHNGGDSLVVPVTATLLVDTKGVVRNAFIDPDYTKRLEPTVAIDWIKALKS
jgi:peroxiredoxin